MKKITYLLLLVLLSNCSGRTPKTSTDVLEPLANCDLLGQQLEIIDIEAYKLEFSILETIEYEIKEKDITEKLIIEKIDSWFYSKESHRIKWNDPGDFHRIKVEKKDSCYTFFNSSGWVKATPFFFGYVPNFPSYNKIQSDYIVLTQNNDDFLLFVFGYVYASQPGLLSIINLSLKEPKLLFNDNYMLSGYHENDPNITVTKFFKEDNINKHDSLLLKDHCLHKL